MRHLMRWAEDPSILTVPRVARDKGKMAAERRCRQIARGSLRFENGLMVGNA